MKSALFLFLFLATPSFAAKEKFRDDQMLRDVHSTFWEAWNKHDAKQMATLFAEDSTRINFFGQIATGRSGVEKQFTEEHSSTLKDAQAISSNLRIQFVNRNVALVDEDAEIGGMKNAEGKMLEPQRLHVANVIVKKAGKWWIAGSRPYFVATPASEIANH